MIDATYLRETLETMHQEKSVAVTHMAALWFHVSSAELGPVSLQSDDDHPKKQ